MPSLNGFIKANPGTYRNGDALKHMPGQTGIKPHTHLLADYDADVGDITVSAKVKMETAKNSGYSNLNTLHVGNGSEDPTGITKLSAEPLELALNFNPSDNKKFTYDPDPADESYPKHYIIPVQIYIGRDYIKDPVSSVTYGVQVTDINGNTTNYENITKLTRQSIGVTADIDSQIKKVVVGNDVTEIDIGMFANFKELVEVDLQSCSAAVEVPEGCCEGCIKLTSFTFPMAGGDYIGDPASSVTYGVQVTDINGNTTNYKGITRLTRQSIGVTAETDSQIKKIVVGNDVTEIDAGAFANFTELVKLDLRSCSTAMNIPKRCCEGCSKLTSFTFPMN